VKLLRVAQVLEATTGGTRTHLNLLAENLDRSRFEQIFICSALRDPGFLDDIVVYRDRAIQVCLVDMCRAIRPIRDLRSFIRLYGLFKMDRPDLVHTHSSKAGFLGRLAARAAGVPAVVHTPHVFAFEQTSNDLLKRALLLVERIAALWADRLICVSQAERRTAVAAGVAPASKVITISNAIKLPSLPRPEDRELARKELRIPNQALVVGTVAHFRKQKGLEDFIEAASGVQKDHPSAVFVLIGAGDRSAIERLAAARGLSSSIRILAARPPLWSYYSAMDVFVLSSRWEGLPYALLEAMASARAVVTTAVGGCTEVVSHGKTGLLTPPGDVRSMAQAISFLLQNESLRSSLGVAARASIASEYRIESRIKELEAIYESLCLQSTASHHPHSVTL
jgi:glycosyltransferase involved in cell wall biosynthesis